VVECSTTLEVPYSRLSSASSSTGLSKESTSDRVIDALIPSVKGLCNSSIVSVEVIKGYGKFFWRSLTGIEDLIVYAVDFDWLDGEAYLRDLLSKN